MKLKCKKDLIMHPAAIEGKAYELHESGNEYVILNEHGRLHYLSKDPEDEGYYGNWFDLEV